MTLFTLNKLALHIKLKNNLLLKLDQLHNLEDGDTLKELMKDYKLFHHILIVFIN